MSKIILPIKSKYVNDIISKYKTFELRRNIPKKTPNNILIYETSPISMIIGNFEVKEIHKLELEKLWNLTKGKNSLSKKQFNEYFNNKKYGYAYEIEKAQKFSKPRNISKYNLKFAPQGFVYVNE